MDTEVVAASDIKPLESWDEGSNFTPVPDVKEQIAEQLSQKDDEIVAEQESTEPVEAKSEETDSEEKVQDSEQIDTKKSEINDVIKVKVNGEEQDVTLDELKKNYSGKVAYDKKFSELDKERKQFIKEKSQIESYVNEFRQIATSQNMVEATKFLGQITGKAPHIVVEEMIKALQPEIERRYGLTQEELSYEQKLADAQYKAEQLENKSKQFEKQQFESNLLSKIDQIMEEKSIPVEEWDKAVLELDARLPKDQELTPELVAEYVVFDRAVSKSSSLLENFQSGTLKGNTKVQETLREIILDNPDFTDEDLVGILNNSFKTSKIEKVEEKLVKKSSTNKQQKPLPASLRPLDSWD